MDNSGKVLLSTRQLREQVIELAQKACTRLPTQASYKDIERGFGLQVRVDQLPIGKDGVYIEEETKIIINSNVTSEERRLFTAFHELIHYLIREDEDLYSYLHDAYEDTNAFDRTIELVCNIGAAELILPRERVRKLIDSQGFSLELVPQLCQQDCVSGPAALIQLVQNAPNRCYGVVCEFGIPPYLDNMKQQAFFQKQKANTLYILYAMWSPSEKYSLARFTPIPKGHLLMQTVAGDNLIKAKDRIPFRSETDWRVPAEAICFRGKVYGLFKVTPPPNPQQPRLL
jgi:Zn-dependent peptidase ImmA (M78 family)